MRHLLETRQKYGGTFVTAFDDGLIVPWHSLTIGDYIKYSLEFRRGVIPQGILEDEIFKKCVSEPSFIRRMPFLKAGIISTVVHNIWQCSGPVGIQEYNVDLQGARDELDADGLRPIHDLVDAILTAFPYKPEEVYAMDYDTFLQRVAQAEKKLLRLKIIETPLDMKDINEMPERLRKRFANSDSQETRPHPDAKKLWEEQQARVAQARTQPQSVTPPTLGPGEKHEKWYDVSPVLEVEKPSHGINFKTEADEQFVFGMDGHEKNDADIERAKLVKDSLWIYKDLILAMEARKKK